MTWQQVTGGQCPTKQTHMLQSADSQRLCELFVLQLLPLLQLVPPCQQNSSFDTQHNLQPHSEHLCIRH